MNFVMPSPVDLARMTPEEIENKRIEAEKEATALSGLIFNLRAERNELERQRLNLSDKINKALQMRKELSLCAEELKSRFWQARNGF